MILRATAFTFCILFADKKLTNHEPDGYPIRCFCIKYYRTLKIAAEIISSQPSVSAVSLHNFDIK